VGSRVPATIEEIPDYVAQQIREPLLGLDNNVVEGLEKRIEDLEGLVIQSKAHIETLERRLAEQGSTKRRKTTQPKAVQAAPQA